jgi:hypothetical protein
MNFRLVAACAALSLGLAGSAFADGRVTATLESPQATPIKFIAAHAMWNCEGSTCIASQAPDGAAMLDGCEGVAKKVGRIIAFSGSRPLASSTLAKCNAVAAPGPIGTASR